MIKELEKYIKENNINQFKKYFDSLTINSHHREQLYKLAFFNQNEKVLDFLTNKTSLTKEKRADFFIEALNKKIQISQLGYVGDFDDIYLVSKLNGNLSVISTEQSNQFLIYFLEKYPVTTLINLKKIIFGAMKSNKDEFLDYLTKKELNNEIIFYSGLCSIKFEKREIFSKIVKNSFKYNPNILNDVKNLKEEYLIKMRGTNYIASKDEIDSFINKTVIESFALHLEEELKKKEEPIKKSSTKRMKI